MRNVYVLGTGMIKFGRYPDKSVPELGAEAALIAMKDAGVAIKDVELFASGNLFQSNAMVGQRILQQIGQTGIPVINVSNACATGSTAFREAYMAVASGMYDVTMAVGVEQMGKQGLLGGGGGGTDPAYATEGRLGSGLMPAVFGQAGLEARRIVCVGQDQVDEELDDAERGELGFLAGWRQRGSAHGARATKRTRGARSGPGRCAPRSRQLDRHSRGARNRQVHLAELRGRFGRRVPGTPCCRSRSRE